MIVLNSFHITSEVNSGSNIHVSVVCTTWTARTGRAVLLYGGVHTHTSALIFELYMSNIPFQKKDDKMMRFDPMNWFLKDRPCRVISDFPDPL